MNILIYAALSIFPVLGLLALGWGVREVWRGISSSSWPQTTGVVRGSAVTENSSRDSRTNTTSNTYSSAIAVVYKVDGKEYNTNTLHFGESAGSSDPSDAEMARLRYPAGKEISVAYNPQNPAIAALKPGFTAEALTLPVIGLAMMLAGIMFMVGYHSASSHDQGMGIWVLRLFASVFMLVGLILLTPGLRSLMRARDSVSWPKAPGTILFSKMTSSTSVDRDDDGHTTYSTTYSSTLVAEYEVNGRKHYTNTRRFGQLAGSDEKWAQEIGDRYPQGAKVQVAYAPADPDLSVLEPGITSEAYWLPGAGAAFFLFGLLAVLLIRF